MERNQILKLSALTFRFLSALMLVVVGGFTLGFLWFIISPESLAGVFIRSQNGFYSLYWQEASAVNDGLALSDLSLGMASWVFVKTTLACVLFYLVFKRALRVVKSIESLDTFKNENVRHFRAVGGLFLWLALLDCFQLLILRGSFTLQFSVPFDFLLTALISFLLAEIFKEGNRLMEENQLTV